MKKKKPFDNFKKGIAEKAQEAPSKARVKNEKKMRKKIRAIKKAVYN